MRLIKLLTAVFFGALLAACGGGGGSAGTSLFGTGSGTTTGTTGTTTTGAASIVLTTSSTTVSAAAPATVKATVLDASGNAQAGLVVTFSTVGGLGSFNVSTALTDATGVATVQLSPASSSSNGADLVKASATVGTATPSATIGFQVAATSATVVGTPSISISLSSTTVTAALPATVSAVVKDAAGNALANQVVKFTTVDPLGTFNPSSALSDVNGLVSVKLSPATTSSNGATLAVAQTTVGGVLVTASSGFTVISTGVSSSGTPSIALTLSNTSVTTASPATATAVVKDGTGAAVAGQVVKFSTVDGLGTFNVSSALSDATGSASVVLSAVGAGKSGADQVLAATTLNGTALQASQGFQLTATTATITSFVSDIATLGPYGQANLTVTVGGSSATAPVSLSLSSACVATGKATITPATASTTTGTATFTYRDNGCGGSATSDPVLVTIVGTAVTKTLNLGVTAPTVSSIIFATATPETIYLKGSGLTETSTLLFTVVDTAGNGLPNQTVTLQLLTQAGGLTLDGGAVPVSKLTDSLGNVSVLINSGTVPTPVRVSATLAGGITTVSSNLAVAVGLPSELNFSLSQGTRNIEGYNIDGTTNTYSIIASDRLANPVPNGTAINFIAEGGQVEPSKTTALVNGIARASANFVSSSPRPLDGRVTVLAYALGEESFLDTNGNNVWDPGIDTQFQDLGAVFLSRKFLNTYFPATDQLIPLSIPGISNTQACAPITTPLLALDTSIPTVGGSTCDGTWGRAYVRRAVETVLSTSSARPLWFSPPDNLYVPNSLSCPFALDTTSSSTPQNLIVGYTEVTGAEQRSPFYQLGGGTTLYNLSVSSVISFLVADANPVRVNPVAAGSSITVAGTTGLTVAVNGGSPVPSSTEATFASIQVTFAAGVTAGTVSINITSPSGLTTTISQNVSTNAAPSSGVTLCN